MVEQIEIEFKTLLTSDEYVALKTNAFNDILPISQENIYIDTDNLDLRNNHMLLRIRLVDSQHVMTLKRPADVGISEIDVKLNNYDRSTYKNIPSEILDILKDKGINTDSLKTQGVLITHRLEKEIPEGLLVLDKSEYLDTVDYELEFEVTDYEKGKADFKTLLDEHGITVKKDIPKSERFYEVLYKEKL